MERHQMVSASLITSSNENNVLYIKGYVYNNARNGARWIHITVNTVIYVQPYTMLHDINSDTMCSSICFIDVTRLIIMYHLFEPYY